MILVNWFKTFQIQFKLIFYLFICNAIDWTMSVCGDYYQRPIWSNIGILYGLFDVFDTNIINTFIQIIFDTIGMYFRSFWSSIKNYILVNNNCNNNSNSTNSKTKLFVKMSILLSWLMVASLIGVTIVVLSNSVSESIFCEIALHFERFEYLYFGMSFMVNCVQSSL